MESTIIINRSESKSYFKMDYDEKYKIKKKIQKKNPKKWQPTYNAKKISWRDIYKIIRIYVT